jgi:hypothetical protein
MHRRRRAGWIEGRVLTADAFVKAVTVWAENRADIVSLALVGSRARGDARSDSDIDLVILCASPALYTEDTKWIAEFGTAQRVSLEYWGNVQSIRVFYTDGAEVEYGVTSPEWATLPLDGGTATVIKDGIVVLLDRDGGLGRALEWAEQSG